MCAVKLRGGLHVARETPCRERKTRMKADMGEEKVIFFYTFEAILHEAEGESTGKNFRQRGRQSRDGGASVGAVLPETVARMSVTE